MYTNHYKKAKSNILCLKKERHHYSQVKTRLPYTDENKSVRQKEQNKEQIFQTQESKLLFIKIIIISHTNLKQLYL